LLVGHEKRVVKNSIPKDIPLPENEKQFFERGEGNVRDSKRMKMGFGKTTKIPMLSFCGIC
jgi:hypothetical protein